MKFNWQYRYTEILIVSLVAIDNNDTVLRVRPERIDEL